MELPTVVTKGYMGTGLKLTGVLSSFGPGERSQAEHRGTEKIRCY